MRRVIAITAVALIALVAVVLVVRAGNDDDGTYRVRAIFENAFTVIPGLDVKVAGVKVGQVDEVEVTRDKKAAVVLRIDEPGFDDFRTDARCQIRPQSLIGEKFIECTTTQPRREGTPPPPALRVIGAGEGEGQRLLPVSQTSRPVDLDLLNNIMRRPFRERFSIILSEFGAGLAGNGETLNRTIRNAVPALRATDEVLNILARQKQVLADLARDGDRSLAPLARDRRSVSNFIEKANRTAQATADRRGNLERNLALLPPFLRELDPTLEQLGAFADQATPTLTDLRAVAPRLNALLRELGPFSRAGIPAFESLGSATEVGRPALKASLPIVQDARRLAKELRPTARDLSALLTSFRDTGGIERLMDFFFYQASAINGFDATGHYLRAGLLVNLCTTLALTPELASCSARFDKQAEEGASARVAQAGSVQGRTVEGDGRSRALVRQDRLLRGERLEDVLKDLPYSAQEKTALEAFMIWDAARRKGGDASAALTLPQILPGDDDRERDAGRGRAKKPEPKPLAPAAAPKPDPAQAGAAQAQEATPETSDALLDYLLGDG